MRDLEQAKAEVFRRSHARIKKRKAIRRWVIAGCVPLMLCVGFWSATILPAMMPASTADSAETNRAPMELFDNSGISAENSIDYERFQEESANASAPGSGQTVLAVHGENFTLSEKDSAIIGDILSQLDYNPHRICRCLPQFKIETSSGSYGLHLDEGYARCDAGQAVLTAEQIEMIREILSRNQIEIN